MATRRRTCSKARPESKARRGAARTPGAAWPIKATNPRTPASLSRRPPPGMSAPFERNVVALGGADVNLAGPHDLRLGIPQHLLPLGQPTRRPRDGEEHREHVGGKAHRLVDEPGVEVDVG